MTRALPAIVLSFSMLMTALAQNAAPGFEAAAIKRSAPQMLWSGLQTSPGGRVEASHLTARAMIGYAYDVRDFQISGGPAWIGSDMYDIVAKTSESPTTPQLRAAMQALLRERFKLAIRHEAKELPLYELVLAKGGSKMQEAATKAGFLRFRGKGQMEAHGASMYQLELYLSTLLDRTVIDKTGLAANYDFTLKWTPDESQSGKPGAQGEAGGGEASIFTALQEQLGLKLNSSKGPIETLVIEQVDRPSDD